MVKEFIPIKDFTETKFSGRNKLKSSSSLDYKAILFYRAGMILGSNNFSGRRPLKEVGEPVVPNARVIKSAMVDQGISQRGLASRVGVSKTTIHAVASGESKVGHNIIEEIANVLGINPEEIIIH